MSSSSDSDDDVPLSQLKKSLTPGKTKKKQTPAKKKKTPAKKKTTRKRARDAKGHYIADNPDTPENEAYVEE